MTIIMKNAEVCLLLEPKDVTDDAESSRLLKTPLKLNELPEGTVERLKSLADIRETSENGCRQQKLTKKSSPSFDITQFLTEPLKSEDTKDDSKSSKKEKNLSELKKEQKEAAFIIRCFQDPMCSEFKSGTACSISKNCLICGQPMKSHEMRKELEEMSETDSARPLRSPLADQTKNISNRSIPALSFGSVQIPMRFVASLNNSTKEIFTRKYLKFDVADALKKEGKLMSNLWELVTNMWKIDQPSVVFSITAGHIAEKECMKTMKAVANALKKITNQAETWIISNGLNSGTSKFLGQFYQNEDSSVDEQNRYSPVFIGATHWGSIERKELLFGISLPREYKSSQYFYSMEYKLSHEENGTILNPFQSIYLLLDNGQSNPGNCAIQFRRELTKYVKQTAAKQIYTIEDVTLPVVLLVVGGDDQTLDQLLYSVAAKYPAIVVNKSGDIPSVLSELYYCLEDVFARTWNEEASDMTPNENRAYENYWKTNERKLAKIFKYAAYSKINETKQIIQRIMNNRYYMTVIDSSFESSDTLHSSILQGIYKGYSMRSGMAVALKTGTYDFLQALFLRNVDQKFKKEQSYIRFRDLNYLHQENFVFPKDWEESSMSKLLKLMCKRECILDKVDLNKSILPVVGRILQLLLGPQYKLMYHEEKYTDVTCSHESHDFNHDKKQEQIWHLFLWSILCAKPNMTQFFLVHTSAPLGASLIAFKLYSNLAIYANEAYEEELAERLQISAVHFQEIAKEILENMYNTDRDRSYEVLISELPFKLGSYVTPLAIAEDANAMDFIRRSCCQTYLQTVWKGDMAVETPTWKSIFFLLPFLIIPWIHCDGSPLKFLRKRPKTPEKGIVIAISKIISYYTAPITKFYERMTAYVCFLVTLSYFVLTDLRPFTNVSSMAPSEWIVIIWVISLIVEEIVQIANMADAGPMQHISWSQLSSHIWHRYEKLRLKLYVLEIYIRSGRWNSIDATMIILFIVSFSLRFSLHLEYFQITRIFFAVTIIICYFRLLRFWYVLEVMGPTIIAIKLMLDELMKFLVVLAVFIVSFGVAFQAILNPNQSPSWITLVDILWRPYWQMFGELFLMDADNPGMGREISDESCINMAKYRNMHCYEWAAPILLGVYLLISMVLLLNLLVAIFGKAYEKVTDKSETIWLFNLNTLIQEFYDQVWLPPPLSLIIHTINFIWYLVKLCRRKKSPIPDDCFRIGQLPEQHDLQKKACKEIRNYNPRNSKTTDKS